MSSRCLAAVVAHLDDDTFGCAGTVAPHERSRLPFRVDPRHQRRERWMPKARRTPRHWVRCARPRTDVRGRCWAACPTGTMAARPRSCGGRPRHRRTRHRIATVFREERPDVVMTFGPDGVTGHPDHIAVGEVVAGLPSGARGGRLILAPAAPGDPAVDARPLEQSQAGGRADGSDADVSARGVPDEQVGVRVDCTGVAMRVLAAVREHVTRSTARSTSGTRPSNCRRSRSRPMWWHGPPRTRPW
jgi:LmbE family N-acetylglucosaminyl deacetylase